MSLCHISLYLGQEKNFSDNIPGYTNFGNLAFTGCRVSVALTKGLEDLQTLLNFEAKPYISARLRNLFDIVPKHYYPKAPPLDIYFGPRQAASHATAITPHTAVRTYKLQHTAGPRIAVGVAQLVSEHHFLYHACSNSALLMCVDFFKAVNNALSCKLEVSVIGPDDNCRHMVNDICHWMTGHDTAMRAPPPACANLGAAERLRKGMQQSRQTQAPAYLSRQVKMYARLLLLEELAMEDQIRR